MTRPAEVTMLAPSGVRDTVQGFAEICADEAAFRAWYEDAAPRVYSYLFARTGGDHALTEDLTQQAFIKAIAARASYDGRAPIAAWICGIARNLLTDHHRRADREERSHLRMVVREIDAGPAQAHAERDDVLSTLRRLPALQRAVLVLRYLDDMTVREVARSVGKTEGATESLLSRARDSFRRRYEGDVP